jgi:hypothetical protein
MALSFGDDCPRPVDCYITSIEDGQCKSGQALPQSFESIDDLYALIMVELF